MKQIDFDGSYHYSPAAEVSPYAAAGYLLEQNYPNPFNPSATISFAVPVDGLVKLSVFNVLGQKVAGPFSGITKAGIHQVEFNAQELSSGVYYYRMDASGSSITRKMLLLR